MEIVTCKIDNYTFQFAVCDNYLQKRFGTLVPGVSGPFKYDRKNWDNMEFFNGQSKDVFMVSVNERRAKAKTHERITAQELKELQKEVQQRNKEYTGEELESIVSKEAKTRGAEKTIRIHLVEYVVIKAVFNDGEWNWKLEYQKSDVQRTGKRQQYMEVEFCSGKIGVEHVKDTPVVAANTEASYEELLDEAEKFMNAEF